MILNSFTLFLSISFFKIKSNIFFLNVLKHRNVSVQGPEGKPGLPGQSLVCMCIILNCTYCGSVFLFFLFNYKGVFNVTVCLAGWFWKRWIRWLTRKNRNEGYKNVLLKLHIQIFWKFPCKWYRVHYIDKKYWATDLHLWNEIFSFPLPPSHAICLYKTWCFPVAGSHYCCTAVLEISLNSIIANIT